MALLTSMAVSAAQSDIQSAGPPQLNLRLVHTSGTQVQEVPVEARPEITCPQATQEAQRSEHQSGGH